MKMCNNLHLFTQCIIYRLDTSHFMISYKKLFTFYNIGNVSSKYKLTYT